MTPTLPTTNGILRYNTPLVHYTWLKVGGPAEILFKPYDLEDLVYFIKNLDKDIQRTTLGAGSNLIIRDAGIKGIAIRLGRNFNDITRINSNLIEVGASCLNIHLARVACENQIGGLAFLSGIPGTIGGGIAMNAGAYGSDYSQIIDSVTALRRNGEILTIPNADCDFLYRSHSLKEDLIFLSAKLRYYSDNSGNIEAQMNSILDKRQATQPITEKTGGSTFANPEGYRAWELIDKVGLRGYSVGGAQFSTKHCNFMINTGDGSANDFENLGELARKKVRQELGINLEWEIKRIGESG